MAKSIKYSSNYRHRCGWRELGSAFSGERLGVVANGCCSTGCGCVAETFVEAAWPALKRLGLVPGASQSNLKFAADLATAVKNADFVQENGPERIDFKRKLSSATR